MIKDQIIKNYALALFSNALNNDVEEKVFEQIKFIEKLIQDNLEIKGAMYSPVLAHEAKFRVILLLEKAVDMEIIVKQFLLILIKHSRISILSKVLLIYSQLLNQKKNTKMVKITSSKVLNHEEKEWIQNYLENDLEQKVIIEYNDDKSIIGGLIIRYDSIIRDYSILGVLKKMSGVMKNTRINWNIG